MALPGALVAQSSPGLPEGVQDTQPDGARPISPAAARDKITLPDGFSVSLFAGEPDLHQPIAFDFDDRGRLWAVECYSYPEFEFRNHDRVVIFTDEDGDGTHDRRQVFWDQGNRLTGIQLGYGGVWLTAPPNLLFIPDEDRDDQPDAEPQIVLDGFTLKASHNFVNGITWAPDGWLWGRHGILAESKPGVPGTPEADRPGLKCGLWRYHPTEKQFEVLAHGTTNPWGLDFDDHGQAFFSNNVIGHLWHLIPGAHYKRMFGNDSNPHVYDLIEACSDHLHWTGGNWKKARGGTDHDAVGGGHSHSGGMIYLGDNWPETYRGQFFMNNIHGNRMLVDTLHRQGSGYVARCAGPFLKANDPWFRGITIKYGPDGGVFVSDWNDLGECHDNDGSFRSSGRLYKIIYGEIPPQPAFDLQALSDLELAAMLSHPNEWHVRHSRRILAERAHRGTVSAAALNHFRETLNNPTDVPKRLRALWALWACEALNEASLARLLTDPSEHLRHWAIRLATDSGTPGGSFVDALVAQAQKEPSALVRLAMAAALQRLAHPDRFRLAQPLLAHAGDAEDANLPLMIWYGIEAAIPTDTTQSLALMQACQIPVVRQYIVRRLASGSQK